MQTAKRAELEREAARSRRVAAIPRVGARHVRHKLILCALAGDRCVEQACLKHQIWKYSNPAVCAICTFHATPFKKKLGYTKVSGGIGKKRSRMRGYSVQPALNRHAYLSMRQLRASLMSIVVLPTSLICMTSLLIGTDWVLSSLHGFD